jgi:hypothetical protein
MTLIFLFLFIVYFKKHNIDYYLKKNDGFDEKISVNKTNIEYINRLPINKKHGFDERFPINNINETEIEYINQLALKKNLLNYLENKNISFIDKLAAAENYLELNKITSYNLTKNIKIE